jgi:hypothetical protein
MVKALASVRRGPVSVASTVSLSTTHISSHATTTRTTLQSIRKIDASNALRASTLAVGLLRCLQRAC